MYLIAHVFLFLFLHHLIPSTAGNSLPHSDHPIDDITVNCGSFGNSIALDGREWIGDIGSQNTFKRHPNGGKLMKSLEVPQFLSADPVPYMSAQVSRSQFSYTFRISPGQKFIRLHFYPASYPGFERSNAFFTVKAGVYTLLRNFSASLTADSLRVKYFSKEFCVHVEENQPLSITFSPSPTTTLDSVYAFVNGIEIISMPTSLYYTGDGGLGAHVVGHKHRFHIDTGTALELVQRLNIGGNSILSVDDWGMFRRWSGDSKYLLEYGVLPVSTSIPIKYTNIPAYAAPQKVYQTAWSMDPNKKRNRMCNLTWKLPLDLGFRYLVRLHFCEIDYEIKEIGQREFGVFMDGKIAEASADLIKWSGGNGVAVYKDYMVIIDGDKMEGKRDLLIAVQPLSYEARTEHHTGAVLSGLEVFKLSNPDNSLASQNPKPLSHAPTSTTVKPLKLLLVFGNGNAIVSCLIIFIVSLNIVVYKLRDWGGVIQKDISAPSKSEELCRRFSLSEIQLATNNFDDMLEIGDGGFGKVYKGLIDKGASTVAVKRLKLTSKQGAEEFWTEIKMLSNLRHTHLVTLIGYCDESPEMILVYEYMVRGTLADHLHKITRNSNGGVSPLYWEQRLNICIGAARGLEYLHTGVQHRVIHRDVKTSNILLDENWVAKISDFGLSKMGGKSTSQASTYIITDVKGTFGYLDVEYFLTHRLTRKSDVYAFGVVLFEALCGRPAVDKRFEGEERSLALWAQQCIEEGTFPQMIDPSIKGQISPHCLKVYVEVANKCLDKRPNERPRMSDIVQRLEFALSSQDQSAYSSTDTEGEQEEEVRESSAVDNMPIERVTEGEEEEQEEEVFSVSGEDKKQIGELVTVQQPIESPISILRTPLSMPDRTAVSMPDSTPSTAKERANKKSISKAVHGLAKVMDFRRRKMKAIDSSSGSSWWWNRAKSPTKGSSPPEPPPELPVVPCRCFSITEIKEATNNFHRTMIIRYGGPGGEMYRGYIDNGKLQVAIERCTKESEHNFLEEVELRSRLHHPHMVSFIGYCKESDETIFVFEYIEKGNLSNHLHGRGKEPLPWKKRLEICIGAAQGLNYLHTGSQKPITHGDLRSSSILLDEKWFAKVSGLKVSNISDPDDMTHTVGTNVVRKTMGYRDPEYLLSGNLTTKSDVYSFGIVLLEVLCAKEPFYSGAPRGEEILAHWFRTCIRKKTMQLIVDPYLIGEMAPKSFGKFVMIAERCLLFRGVERPAMQDVVKILELALQLQETAGDHIKFGKPGDPPEAIHKAAVRAYNQVL